MTSSPPRSTVAVAATLLPVAVGLRVSIRVLFPREPLRCWGGLMGSHCLTTQRNSITKLVISLGSSEVSDWPRNWALILAGRNCWHFEFLSKWRLNCPRVTTLLSLKMATNWTSLSWMHLISSPHGVLQVCSYLITPWGFSRGHWRSCIFRLHLQKIFISDKVRGESPRESNLNYQLLISIKLNHYHSSNSGFGVL